MNIKKKYIIVGIIIVVLILLSSPLLKIYKKNEMNKLIDITNNCFEEYIKEKEDEDLKNQVKSTYDYTETVIMAGDKDEFVGAVYYGINTDTEEKIKYTSAEYKVRVKNNNGEYEVLSIDDDVTAKGLKLVNYSSNDEKQLHKIKKELDIAKYERSAAIYIVNLSDRIRLSYDKNKNYIDVPMPPEYAKTICLKKTFIKYNGLKENSNYITHKKTAFISTDKTNLLIMVSDDKGETWNETIVEDGYKGGELFIGFASKDVGYYMVTTETTSSQQEHYIYLTKDGGKSWNEIGNLNDICKSVVSGVSFLDENIGFVSFKQNGEDDPIVYRTDDSGQTWKKLEIHLPYKYSANSGVALSPIFKDDKGMLPVKFRHSEEKIYFVTSDKGITWDYVDETEDTEE